MGSILVIIGQLWYSYMVKPQWNNLIEILNRPHWCCPNLRWLGSLRPVVANKKGMSKASSPLNPHGGLNTTFFWEDLPPSSSNFWRNTGNSSVLQLGETKWLWNPLANHVRYPMTSHIWWLNPNVFDAKTPWLLLNSQSVWCWKPAATNPGDVTSHHPGLLVLLAGVWEPRARSWWCPESLALIVFLMRLSTVYGNYNMLLYYKALEHRIHLDFPLTTLHRLWHIISITGVYV